VVLLFLENGDQPFYYTMLNFFRIKWSIANNIKLMRNFLLFIYCIILFGCEKNTVQPPLAEAPLYFPPIGTAEWQTTDPATLNWDTSKLPVLYNYLLQEDTRAFIVLQDGKIVLEKYFGQNIQGNGSFSQNSLWYWASAGKTLTGFIVGKAQQDGFLNISNKTSQYLGTGWTSASPDKENLITVRHQLTMTTGLDDTGDQDNTNPSALTYHADAGRRWAYHNAPYTLLQQVVSNASGQSFDAYFNAQLKTRIGMDGQWIINGYNHVYWSTARSMARFGILMQARGKWDDINILSDTSYLMASVNTSQNINLSYGYLWWLNGKSSFMVPQSQLVFPGSASSHAPADMYSALGKDGQLLNIVPSKGLVMVRMGSSPNAGLVSLTLQDGIWEKLKEVIR
jgi:CubicO group peptidase (beta-lactamase class C family)